MRFILLILLGVGTLATPALARPVSYPGGITFMTMNDADRHMLHLLYSPTAHYAVGYAGEYWRDQDFTLNTLQLNNLLKRWNKPGSQANLYLKSGIGMAYSDAGKFDHEKELAGFTGIAADWENRRYFVSYENRYMDAGKIADFFMQSARVGITPYIGDYGDLHTWLMMEVEHKPESDDKVTVTPMVRLFKGDHLVEAGVSNKGDALFNWVVRF